MGLQIIFGLTQSISSLYLRFGMNLLILVLQDLEKAKIKIPSANKITELQSLVRPRHPKLADVWCTMSLSKFAVSVLNQFLNPQNLNT
jgi:hypothetical protein